ncbi:MAG: hypothetical protein V7606_674 [Burkholderiales bacterium]
MKQRIGILVLHFAIFFALAYAYENFVSVQYGYEGYVFHPDEANRSLALICVAALSLITPVEARKPSTIFHHLTLVAVLLPMLVMFYAAGQPWEYMAQCMFAYAVTTILPLFLKITPPKFANLSKHDLRRVLVMITFIYIVAVLLMGGARYMNFDLSRVYDFRRDAASNLPGIFAYISPLIGKVVVPIALVISLLYKKYSTALLVVGCAILIFGMTAHKSTLFAPFAILLVYYVSLSRNLIFKFNLALLALIMVGLGDFWLQQNYSPDTFGTMATMTLQRVLFTPAYLNNLYFDFFSKNEWVLFSNSKLSLGLMDYPYTMDVSYQIGYTYFNDDRMSANTGWFGSAYMQAGFMGVLLYAVIMSALYKYIDACARRSGEPALITASVIVPAIVIITSADLPVSLVTHGLYVNLLLIACFHKEDISHAYSPPQQRSFA